MDDDTVKLAVIGRHSGGGQVHRFRATLHRPLLLLAEAPWRCHPSLVAMYTELPLLAAEHPDGREMLARCAGITVDLVAPGITMSAGAGDFAAMHPDFDYYDEWVGD